MFSFSSSTNFWQRLTFVVGDMGVRPDLPQVLRRMASEYGVTGCVVKVAHGLKPQNDVHLEGDWVAEYRGSQGYPVGAWAVLEDEPGAAAALYHVLRTQKFTSHVGAGNRLFLANAEYLWRQADQDFVYLSEFRRQAPTMMLGFCPEGSEWAAVEGHDYESWLGAGARCVPQCYDGQMNPYDVFTVWRNFCIPRGPFHQSYTRPMFGVTSATPPADQPGYWRAEIESLEQRRRLAGMAKPLGGMIYLGDQAEENEWAVAEISEAMFRLGLAKT